MEDRSSRRMRTLVTQMARRGLSVNEVARALISMMARSTTRSNQRPDTLMQDRICQVDETSCNARPDHTWGQVRRQRRRARVFRFTLTADMWTNAGFRRYGPESGSYRSGQTWRHAVLRHRCEPDYYWSVT